MSLQLEVLSETGGLNIVSDRTYLPPFGVFGGHSALPNEWKILREGHEQVIPGGKAVNHPLRRGDVVAMNTGGAGGYGDPLERDPERVRQDMLEGLVSPEAAGDLYGVVVRGEGLEMDLKATLARRAFLRARRRLLAPRKNGEPAFDGGIRVLFLSPEADGQELQEGDLVELVSPHLAAPVRFRLRQDPEGRSGEVIVDAEAWGSLGLEEGGLVELRRIENRNRRLTP